jgi:hypothetical protein
MLKIYWKVFYLFIKVFGLLLTFFGVVGLFSNVVSWLDAESSLNMNYGTGEKIIITVLPVILGILGWQILKAKDLWFRSKQ